MVTDENVRADGSSIKCRDCDTLIYFKNPPPKRIEIENLSTPQSRNTERAKTKQKKEYSKPVSVPEKQVLKEEKREQRKHVRSSVSRDTEKQRKKIAVKVPPPEGIKTKTSSQMHTLFEQILEKIESKGKDSFYGKWPIPSKDIQSPSVSYITVLIVIVVCIILFGFIINVLSE